MAPSRLLRQGPPNSFLECFKTWNLTVYTIDFIAKLTQYSTSPTPPHPPSPRPSLPFVLSWPLPRFLSCIPTVIPSSKSTNAYNGFRPNSFFHVILSSWLSGNRPTLHPHLSLHWHHFPSLSGLWLYSAVFHFGPSVTRWSSNNK